uniref:Uncharacterized protein n=1 Tax=Arundo donax TaxID=35708 RepID=A0A0A9B6Q1_ARUDO
MSLLCLRANSSSCDRNIVSCSFMTSVLTLATFSPTSRNWSRVAAAFCKPAIPGRLLMLLGGGIYLAQTGSVQPPKYRKLNCANTLAVHLLILGARNNS